MTKEFSNPGLEPRTHRGYQTHFAPCFCLGSQKSSELTRDSRSATRTAPSSVSSQSLSLARFRLLGRKFRHWLERDVEQNETLFSKRGRWNLKAKRQEKGETGARVCSERNNNKFPKGGKYNVTFIRAVITTLNEVIGKTWVVEKNLFEMSSHEILYFTNFQNCILMIKKEYSFVISIFLSMHTFLHFFRM